MLRYRDLTPEQKTKICNGCGGKGGFINPPEFLFHASCNQHDFYYWRGGTETDRKEADDTFYKFMQLDVVVEDNFIKRNYYSLIAFVYYKAVRLFGRKYFNYGKRKTKDDL
jgi:hypothetical protein